MKTILASRYKRRNYRKSKCKIWSQLFWKKPPIDDDEIFLMENQTRFPKTKKDKARDKQIERMKKNLGNILVSPYNSQQWSRY